MASLCCCFPVGLLLIWALPVRRGDGSTWSLGWKIAYSMAFVVPFGGIALYMVSQGVREGGGYIAAPLVYLSVICVAIADAIYHRMAAHHHDHRRNEKAKEHASARSSSDQAIDATTDASDGSELDKQ
jgi:CBS-domain-containing membrane protein